MSRFWRDSDGFSVEMDRLFRDSDGVPMGVDRHRMEVCA